MWESQQQKNKNYKKCWNRARIKMRNLTMRKLETKIKIYQEESLPLKAINYWKTIKIITLAIKTVQTINFKQCQNAI